MRNCCWWRWGLLALGLGVCGGSLAEEIRAQQPGTRQTETLTVEVQTETAELPPMATVAEASNYAATATERQVESFLRELAGQWAEAELTTIGRTIEGRPLWALVVEPSEETTESVITVLMLGGIHSGECDGKEALLALARDTANGLVDDSVSSLRLIFVPNFNADGNERRGREHRPGQAGPDHGMGVRENAQNLDLNRDFVKLDSPEVRGLVAAINQYDVDILIDTHTTNGSLHQYDLTYDIPHTPTLPATVDRWLREQLVPQVTDRLADAGFDTFYYGNFDADHRRWSTYGHQPRYSTEYMGLRGKIGILSESYSYVSYETRVKVSYAFVKEILQAVARDPATIRQMLDESAQSAKVGQSLPIQAELAKTADGVVAKGFQREDGSPPVGAYGAQALASHAPKDYRVQLWNSTHVTDTVSLPAAYAISPQYAWAVGRLQRHGVQLQRLVANTKLSVQTYRIEQMERLPEFQRHRRHALQVAEEMQERVLPSGTYIVSIDQPLGVLAAFLLEPGSDDNLASWNFFDPDLREGEEYPVVRLPQLPADQAMEAVTVIPATEQITLERLYAPGRSVAYGGDRIRGARWLKNSSEYVVRRGTRTLVIDAQTGATRRLTEVDAMRAKLADMDAFSNEQAAAAASIDAFSEDWAHALVTHQGDLYFFDSDTQAARQLTHSPDEPEQLAALSPAGTHVAFVRDNNLWLVDCETTEIKQLTTDGSPDILNGILDWVYQEELYGRGNFKGFWWSPDGRQLAFLQLDQTPVPRYAVTDSIHYGQQLENTRYPKAGQPLPTVNVRLLDISTGEITAVDLSKFDPQDRLVARVSWSPETELWLQVFNRVQNRQDLVRVDPEDGSARTLLTEVSPGWIEVRGTPRFLPNGDFLWLSDLPLGRTHLVRVSGQTGQRTALTSGDWDVSELVSISQDSQTAFVTGNISHPTEQQLLAVDLHSGTMRQVTLAPGTHRPQVDASGKFFIDVFSSKDSAPFASVHSIGGQMLRVIDAQISDRHQFLDIAAPRSFTITARDGLELQAQLILPAGFDPAAYDEPATSGLNESRGDQATTDAAGKLPVVVYVYGGPQAPTVSNAWAGRNYWWHQMLAQRGFAVLLCDNRSSRGRGVNDTWTIRGDLCKVELRDLEDAVGWLREQPWVDADRVGLWGWSYGGYFTSYALTHSQLFRCGIAGAPVTDWRNYDAIYTERYMGLPQENEAGYTSSSSVAAAADLNGQLLIIHGERDDNVHLSNTLQLAYALQKAGKQFDLMIYPKNRHGVVDPDQRFHMYRMMTNFFERHLMNQSQADPSN